MEVDGSNLSWWQSRPLPIWIITLLFLVQLGGLILLTALATNGNLVADPSLGLQISTDIDRMLLAVLSVGSGFIVLTFATLRPWAWNFAMLTEGGLLLTALLEYESGATFHVFIMMLFGIVMVLYLNHKDVRQAFLVTAVALAEDVP